METLLNTLRNIFIYTVPVVLGILVGTRPAVRARPLARMGTVQTAVLLLLIFSLGVQLGANREITASLGEIGLTAMALTLTAMAGSLLTVTLLRRFVLRPDRFGLPGTGVRAGEDGKASAQRGRADLSMTWRILLAVALGMAAGRFLIPAAVAGYSAYVTDYGLRLLLFLVGVDMGHSGSVLQQLRAAGPGAVLIPLGVTLGSVVPGTLAGLLLPTGVKGAAAVTAGLGWYSLTPSLIAPWSLKISAVAFLSNVLREMLSVVLIPIVARCIGYVECIALPGAAAMDSSLPVVVGATHPRITVWSFASGVVLSLIVPFLVPLIVAL
ncbi:MAG: lysine exporter LysO family protein [Oscillospiraceae bacterium]|nr:lysine exporter LysO family protein [Oscillospiraceae bacterium]